uniref:Leucine rich repeat containing 56 n=1 Tax=Mastacembelus armatus TaxID=205130 RepID=A0A7N9ASU4_9TELE
MNNSIIMSVRDLGTSLSHLQILWMSHCCLQDLGGISTLISLKELYIAYNSVSDLSQICMLDSLQLLDLEGNDVDDLVQVQYLGLCGELRTLTLEGNPVCVRPNPTATQTAPNQSTFTPRDLPIHVPEHTYDLEEPDVREREDVFAELKAWREQHSRRLQVIETERLPQILAIQYSDDEEEEEDDDEKEGFNGMKKDNKEHMEGMHSYNVDTASLDSSFQSLSPVLHHREPISPGVARLSLSTDATMSPFPPLRATAASGCPKQQGIRARRLRLSKASSEHLSYSSTAGCSAGTGMTAGDTDPAVHGVQQVTRTTVPLISQAAHRPYPPPTSALGEGLMSSCLAKDVSSGQSGDKHQMSKLLGRPPITRPHTARAALQKHHQQRILQPCRGSSYPD